MSQYIVLRRMLQPIRFAVSCFVSRENPLLGGERRLQPSGWVLPVPEQPTPAPLRWRGIIFMLYGAAQGGMDNSLENRSPRRSRPRSEAENDDDNFHRTWRCIAA